MNFPNQPIAAVPPDVQATSGPVAGVAEFEDHLLDAICIVDAEGRFLAVRGACEAIFGYRPEEMVGRPMIDFVFDLDRPRTLQAVQRIMAGYLQRHFENRYVRKDGRLVHIMWSARWSPHDGVRVAVARDLTNRAEARTRAETLPEAADVVGWMLCRSPARLVPPGLSAISLSAQDHTVLLALATGGECVHRRAIVKALGADYLRYDQRRLDSQMRRLRRKVQEACGLQLPVATVRGVGYRVCAKFEVCP